MKQFVAICIKNVPNYIVVKELLSMRISINEDALLNRIGASSVVIDSKNKQYMFITGSSYLSLKNAGLSAFKSLASFRKQFVKERYKI